MACSPLLANVARSACLTALVLSSCGPGTQVPTDSETDVSAQPSESDEAPIDDTEAPTVPVDTDRPAPVETDTTDDETDSPPPPPEPPTFSGQLTDLSAPWMPGSTDSFEVDPGEPAVGSTPFRSPAHGFVLPADVDQDGVIEVVAGVLGPGGGLLESVRVFRMTPQFEVGAHDAALRDALVTDARVAPYGFLDIDDDGFDDVLYPFVHGFQRRGGPHGYGAVVPLDPQTDAPWGLAKSMVVGDVDHDGWLDIVAGEQNCVDNLVVVHDLGDGDHVMRPLRAPGSSTLRIACVQGLRGPGGRDLWLPQGTNCDNSLPAHAGFIEMAGLDDAGWPILEEVDPTPADAYWRFDPVTAGGPYTRAMPMGTAVGDVNGDGIMDLLLSLSVDRLVLLLGMPDGSFTDATLDAGLSLTGRAGVSGLVDTPWSVALVDLDQDGRLDVLASTGDDVTEFRMVSGPPFTSAAWWNDGQGGFVEITDAIGLDIEGSWRALIVSDLDEDGDADLWLGGWGTQPRLLRNDLTSGNHGLSLSLEGTTSNHLGIGARIEIEAAGIPTATHQMTLAGSDAPLIEPVVFAGLGQATQADVVRVHWPSGTVQEVHDLTAGTHHRIREPESLTWSHSGRTRRPNGTGTTTLTIAPRDLDGLVRAVSTVEVHTTGTEVLISAVQGPHTDGTYTVEVTSPTDEGSTVFVVTVDGVPMGVNPRIWWRSRR